VGFTTAFDVVPKCQQKAGKKREKWRFSRPLSRPHDLGFQQVFPDFSRNHICETPITNKYHFVT
jgi:hypothetical protein